MTEIIEKPITEIAEYSPTAAALSDLRSKYEKVVFPVETTKGMKDALSARKELRDLRVNLEKLRKDIKEPALRRCQMIDSEAKTITAQLTALEDPIDAQIKAEERRKEAEKQERERVERERVAAIRAKIDGIRRLSLDSANDTLKELADTIFDLQAHEIDDSYAEFADEAKAAKEGTLLTLGSLFKGAMAREEESARLKAEREELDRQRAELEKLRADLAPAKEPEGAEIEKLRADIAPAAAPEPETEPEFQLSAEQPAAPQPTEAPAGGDLIVEFAHYTAMQFFALADKVEALGHKPYAVGLRKDAEAIAAGNYNENMRIADWKALAEADKRMALSSHACVSVLEGDAAMGPSALRQYDQQAA